MNIALPTAQRELGFSNADRQWVMTAYSLAFGGLLLLGHRRGGRGSGAGTLAPPAGEPAQPAARPSEEMSARDPRAV